MASETTGRAVRGGFYCGCGSGVFGHTTECGNDARAEVARLSARVAELERVAPSPGLVEVERLRLERWCEGTSAEVARLREALASTQRDAAALRERAQTAETRAAAAERKVRVPQERVAGLERRLKQEMGCREASDRRAAEAEAQLSAALAEVARLRLAAPAPQPQPLSCPFCGGPCHVDGKGTPARPWFVVCDSTETCGVMGPNYPTEAEAVREWAAIRVEREGV